MSCMFARQERKMTDAADADFHAFPSINQFRHFVMEIAYRRAKAPESIPWKLTLLGTVKLHGTHADVVAVRHADDTWRWHVQSRNRKLEAGSDNMGCFAFLSAGPVDALIEAVVARHRDLHGWEPDRIEIAGEFCGGNIQKHVALNQLPRMFVAFGVRIDGMWRGFGDYSGAFDSFAAAGVYSVLRAPSHRIAVDTRDLTASEPELMALTASAAAACPFAATFGIDGRGEGLVWTVEEWKADSRIWFKTKGAEFAGAVWKEEKEDEEGESNDKQGRRKERSGREAAAQFAKCAVREPRLLQGLEYLSEMGLPILTAEDRDRAAGPFVSWVIADVLKEEWDVLASWEGLGDAAAGDREVRTQIGRIARQWLASRASTSGDE